MDKLKMHSPNLTEGNIAKLAELFPNCVTETKNPSGELTKSIDFDLLKQELSSAIVEGPQERYQLNWPGKREALLTANAPIAKTLRPCREESVDFDTTENLFIEGDNLDALKLLQETYLGKVKMIYIDPPYNTGNDFIYEDDFAENTEAFLKRSNQKDEDGNRMVANTESNGRFHSDWLSMMYPRLKLARNLLRDDGVIFISIDDNEVHNLRKLCDEVFGGENYINSVSVNSKVSAGASGGGEDKKLKKNIESLLIYARDFSELPPVNSVYKETLLFDYIAQMKKDGKSFKYTNLLYKKENVKFIKSIKDGAGDSIDIFEVCDFEFKTVKQVAAIEKISEEQVFTKYYDQIMATTNAQTSIRDRVWEATGNENQLFAARYTPKSGKNKGNTTELLFYGKQKVLVIWLRDTAIIRDKKIYKREKIGTYWDGFSWINVSKEGDIKFDNGKKPISMIQRMIALYTPSPEALILDFFAGSATTAHAVMQLNAEDGGKRKFIMVQLPEPCDEKSEAFKAGYKTIAEISKERIRRAGRKILEENPQSALADSPLVKGAFEEATGSLFGNAVFEAPLHKGGEREALGGVRYSNEWLKSQGLVFNGKTLPYNPKLFERARELRKEPTKEENHLWYDFLSAHDQKFTRQKVIGHYIVDFYCAPVGLVIEVDGSHHYTDEGLAYDNVRTDYLEQFDITVLRFTNEQIRTSFSNVCAQIDHALKKAPLHKGGDCEAGGGVPGLDTGFRVLKVDSSNMVDLYYQPDKWDQDMLAKAIGNIKHDRTSEDLLFQVILDWGTDLLTKQIERVTISGNEVFFVDGNALAACFEKEGKITEAFCKELAGRQPLRVVFRDSGFENDSVKINVGQIFKLMSPHTDVKTL